MYNRLSKGYSDIVKTKRDTYVFVDSRNTADCGYETMVFNCNESGMVDDWLDIDVDRYLTYEDMAKGHMRMINKWKEHE